MNILVGVCGGIAIYKTCELVRALVKAGHGVRVIMTGHAQEFVTPLLFETLSQTKVYTTQFSSAENTGTEHIDLAKWADCLVVAPATANCLGKFANGIADDYLSTFFTAFKRTVHLFPAMNTAMYEHAPVQRNINYLSALSHIRMHEPIEGVLACGDVGVGKMLEPEEIFRRIVGSTEASTSLRGKRVLITAGPTRAYIDPIRFISNTSTGKMGIALCQTAVAAGAEVVLVHGPLLVPIPAGVHAIAVESADQMLAEAASHWPRCDIFVGCAAVNDFKPAQRSVQKIKKTSETTTLDLLQEVDVIAAIAKQKRPGQIVVGFAAETEHVEAHARAKMRKKGLDYIVVNDASQSDVAFGSNDNEVRIFKADDADAAPGVAVTKAPKATVAQRIWEIVAAQG